MKLIVNGEEKQLRNSPTIADLIQELQFDNSVAVALNQNFVPKSLYQEQRLNEGDSVEVLSPMVGG